MIILIDRSFCSGFMDSLSGKLKNMLSFFPNSSEFEKDINNEGKKNHLLQNLPSMFPSNYIANQFCDWLRITFQICDFVRK